MVVVANGASNAQPWYFGVLAGDVAGGDVLDPSHKLMEKVSNLERWVAEIDGDCADWG